MKNILIASLMNLFMYPLGFFYLGIKRIYIINLIFLLVIYSLIPILIFLIFFHSGGKITAYFLIIFWTVFLLLRTIYTIFIGFRIKDQNYKRLNISYLIFPFILSVFISYPIEIFIEKPFSYSRIILSMSMYPTLKIGDKIKIRDLSLDSNLVRGKIYIHQDNIDDKVVINRLVGLPGDKITIFIKNKEFILRINNKVIESDFSHENVILKNKIYEENLFDQKYLISSHEDRLDDIPSINLLLKDNEYFFLGDARCDSFDSRFYGPVLRGKILSEYLFTYYSINYPDEYLANPDMINIFVKLKYLLLPDFERLGYSE